MVKWAIEYSEHAIADARLLATAGLKQRVQSVLETLAENPLAAQRSYDKLTGELEGTYSRRINIEHRLVYEVFEKERAVRILRMWTPKHPRP